MHKDDDWSTYMLDIWVENIKTKECWRYDDDPAKDVYQCEGIPLYKNDMSMYRFYPCCPKTEESTYNETSQGGFTPNDYI